MRLKISELDLGFQNRKFKIFSKDLADRGTVYRKEIIFATLSLIKDKGCFYLNGNLEATLQYTCVRCLIKSPSKINLPINILILEETMNYTTGNDYDVIYFSKSNDYLSLKNIFADLIALAEPIQTLCNQNCTGLCSTCGKEKSNPCNCNHSVKNDTWDKLKDLNI